MVIDIIVLILLAMAVLRGYRLGLITGICSYLAFIIGLAAAMKLSAVVALKIGEGANVSGKWMPFVSFALVFIVTVILVRWIAGLLQKVSEKIMLGWFNKLGGILFFVLIYISAFAVVLFYINQMGLLPDNVESKSMTYSYIKPVGKYAIDSLGAIVPAFKNLFGELEHFFDHAAQQMH